MTVSSIAPKQRAKKKSKAARRKKRHAFIDRHVIVQKMLPLYFLLIVGGFNAVKALTGSQDAAYMVTLAVFCLVIGPLNIIWDEKCLRHYKADRRRWNKERKLALAAGKSFTEPAPKKPSPIMDFAVGGPMG